MEDFDFTRELLAIRDKLFYLACRLAATKEEAEDLVQETLLKALENKEKYLENMNFGGWLYSIMRNLFINKYWAESRRPSVSGLSELIYNTFQDDHPYSVAAHNLDYKEILDIVKTLSEKNHTAFHLFISGFKYQEIADMTQEPLGTVKSRIHYCRQKLKKLLSDFI